MFRDIRKNKTFSRRTLFVGGVQASLTTVLAARLSYLQIYKHKEYSIQSDSNSVKLVINPAGRGIIYDRNNVALTQNQTNYRLYLYLEDKKNVAQLVDNLVEILKLNWRKKKLLLRKIHRARKRSMISLIDNLDWSDVARIEVNSYRLEGTKIEAELIRKYPFPFETAHFIGYVSTPNDKEVSKKEQALYRHPSFRIGKTGLERSFDQFLRGKYGAKYVEVNSLDRPIRTISVDEAVEGPALNLTIDIELQKFVTKRISQKTASVVVMDVKSGEILSFVSSPSFNGNNFVEGISQEYWDQVSQDKRLPLSNRVISAAYPPGSTFKMMTALAALEDGIDPLVKYNCNGKFKLGKGRFRCWKKTGHGRVNLVEAIMESCNVYFYNIANQVGIEKIAAMARKFGYGEKFGVGLYGARSGNIPSFEWKRKIFHQSWVGGDTLNSAIGQGFVLSTPIQMAVATARLANGGVPIEPYLIKSQKSQTQFDNLSDDLLVKKENLDLVLQGMSKVVNDKKGTAYYQRIRQKDFAMAGKTGTSQVISKRKDEMTKFEISQNINRNHAIFVGFAPAQNPKYCVSVIVEHGGSGSVAAAPIGRDVLLKTQEIVG